ncbi:MAG: hypothetical protein HY040_13415 [Planctomycetes bacterium]|nr:hypothetical protein [Planctomycetota bacterium]
MAIKLDELKKLEFASAPAKVQADPKALLTAIFKVKPAAYVPSGVKVRSRIDDHMFTGSFKGSILRELETDPKVVSVALSKRLKMID